MPASCRWFFYLFIARVSGADATADPAANPLINVVTCVAFIAISTFIAYRGITTSERVQAVLVSFQMLILLLFVVVAITRSLGGDDPLTLPFSWTWFNPFTGLELSAFIAGVVGSIFAFWVGTSASPSTRRARAPQPHLAGRRSSPC